MNEMRRASWASAKAKSDFIDVTTCSGYRATYLDPQAGSFQCESSASDEELGQLVINALERSRFLTPAEALSMQGRVVMHYEEWVRTLMEKYGYKSRRAFFKGMKSCTLTLEGGVITVSPSHHEKLEGWSGKGIDEDAYVAVAAQRPLREIGEALRLAFSRCTEQ